LTIRVVRVWFFGLLTIPIFGRDGGANGACFFAAGAAAAGAGGVNVCVGGGVGVGVEGGVGGGVGVEGGVGGGDGGDGGDDGGIQFFTALPLFAWPGADVPVVRVSDLPPTGSVVDACTVSVPPADEVIVAAQDPAVVVQLDPPTNDPTEPERSAKLTDVPFGAAT